jgi:hemoglobin
VTIFEQIGGGDVIAAAVDEFYERVLDDAELAPSFTLIDLDRLKAHQRAFLSVALDGPQTYDGRSLTEAHAGLGITSEQFDRSVCHLVATFISMHVNRNIIEEVAARLESLRSEIVEPQVRAS